MRKNQKRGKQQQKEKRKGCLYLVIAISCFFIFIRLFLCALFISFERATSNYYSSVFFLCVCA